MNNSVICPNCGSTQVAAVRKNYDAGCGCIGLLLFGLWGLLLGLLGGGDVEMVCASCGARWTPGKRRASGCLLILFLILLAVIAVHALHAGPAARAGTIQLLTERQSTASLVKANEDKTTRMKHRESSSPEEEQPKTLPKKKKTPALSSEPPAQKNTGEFVFPEDPAFPEKNSRKVRNYRNASGEILGSAEITRGGVVFRDSKGSVIGASAGGDDMLERAVSTKRGTPRTR